jgi:hypothetical protein
MPSGMPAAVREHCGRRIRETPLRREPFPHLVIEGLLPEAAYAALLAEFPKRERFRRADYAGTGFSRREPHYVSYGLALPREELAGACRELVEYFESDEFARLLLDKFEAAIPEQKRAWFGGTAPDYGSRCHLHIDLPGYEIPPHPDAEDKILTYQMYLPRDESVREYGTHLLRPRGGRATVERPGWELAASRGIEWAARRAGLWERGWVRRMRETEFGFRHGLLTRMWYPWEWFETRAMAEALPNHLLAFAPSERSYHAVKLDIPADHPCPERPVARGFVRRGLRPFDRVAFRD